MGEQLIQAYFLNSSQLSSFEFTTMHIQAHGGYPSHFSSSEFIAPVNTCKPNYLKEEAKLDTIIYEQMFGWGLIALRVGTDHTH